MNSELVSKASGNSDLELGTPATWEIGAITAEFATTLPAVLILLAVIIAQAAAFGTQLRVSDAARTGARLAAIGVDHVEVKATVSRMLGGHPDIQLTSDGTWVTVRVNQSLRLGPLWLPQLAARGEATSWVEPVWGSP